jgi:hypothetical protein
MVYVCFNHSQYPVEVYVLCTVLRYTVIIISLNSIDRLLYAV